MSVQTNNKLAKLLASLKKIHVSSDKYNEMLAILKAINTTSPKADDNTVASYATTFCTLFPEIMTHQNNQDLTKLLTQGLKPTELTLSPIVREKLFPEIMAPKTKPSLKR